MTNLQCSINSVVRQTDPVFYIYSFSHIILHHVLLQVTRYSPLCYIAGTSITLYITNTLSHLEN